VKTEMWRPRAGARSLVHVELLRSTPAGPEASILSPQKMSHYCAPLHIFLDWSIGSCCAWADPPLIQGINDLGNLAQHGGGASR